MQESFYTNLVKIHSAVIKMLYSCFMLFLEMADGGHLGMANCKQNHILAFETFVN